MGSASYNPDGQSGLPFSFHLVLAVSHSSILYSLLRCDPPVPLPEHSKNHVEVTSCEKKICWCIITVADQQFTALRRDEKPEVNTYNGQKGREEQKERSGDRVTVPIKACNIHSHLFLAQLSVSHGFLLSSSSFFTIVKQAREFKSLS
jgi:hypothetical protein